MLTRRVLLLLLGVLPAAGCGAALAPRAPGWPHEALAAATAGRFDAAEPHFRAALPAERDRLLTVSELGLRLTGDVHAAVIDTATAVLLFRSLAATRGAAAPAQQAVARSPGYALAHTLYALALLNARRVPEAIASLTRAIELEPTDAYAWMNRGVAHARASLRDLAVTDFEHAVELAPDMPLAHYNRGHNLAQQQRFREAASHFERTTTLAPGYPAGWYYLALSRYETCDFAGAIAPMERAVALGHPVPAIYRPDALRTYAAGEFPAPQEPAQCGA
jgi:tetratricopeptide (TPR) repeat protein